MTAMNSRGRSYHRQALFFLLSIDFHCRKARVIAHMRAHTSLKSSEVQMRRYRWRIKPHQSVTRCKPGGHMINQLLTAEIWLVLMKTNQLRLDQSLPEQTANRKLTSCQKGEISERNNSQTHTHTQTEAHILRQTCTCTHTSLDVYICRHTHTHSCISLCISLVRHDFLTWGMSPHKHTYIYQIQQHNSLLWFCSVSTVQRGI